MVYSLPKTERFDRRRVEVNKPMGVVSAGSSNPPPRRPPIRCLFIAWNDGAPPSQFSVPERWTLPRNRPGRRPLPSRLTVFDDDAQTELYLDTSRIRSAYLVTLAEGQRVVDLSGS